MFIDNPILFGDFLKMGADKADRMYEELNDFTKLKTILNDVSLFDFYLLQTFFSLMVLLGLIDSTPLICCNFDIMFKQGVSKKFHRTYIANYFTFVPHQMAKLVFVMRSCFSVL